MSEKVRLKTALRALDEQRKLAAAYTSVASTEAGTGPIERVLTPVGVYENREGQVVLVAFDSHRGAIREFRLDRFSTLRLKDHFELKDVPEGKTRIWPAAYKALRFGPGPWMADSATAVNYIAQGKWSPVPHAAVIQFS